MKKSISISLAAILMASPTTFASSSAGKTGVPKFKTKAERDAYFRIEAVEIREVPAAPPGLANSFPIVSESAPATPAQQNWSQMEYWRGPARRTFEMNFKNGFGMTLVHHA